MPNSLWVGLFSRPERRITPNLTVFSTSTFFDGAILRLRDEVECGRTTTNLLLFNDSKTMSKLEPVNGNTESTNSTFQKSDGQTSGETSFSECFIGLLRKEAVISREVCCEGVAVGGFVTDCAF